MKIVALIARVLLGLVFLVFGLNLFLHFIHMPPPEGQAGAFFGALFVSGYIYPIAVLQVVGGLLMLSGRFIPIGLVLLGPVIVNIVLFHICLDPKGLPMAIGVAVLSLIVLAHHRQSFAPLLKA